jgi:hypothetical protein
MMKRALFILLCAFAWVGCGDDSTEPQDISGRYELRTVNGSNLPYTVIQVGNSRVEILSGFLNLNGDGTFSSSLTTRTTQGTSTSTTSDTGSGTWTQTGNQLSFRESDGTQATGVLSGTQITSVVENVSLVFSK